MKRIHWSVLLVSLVSLAGQNLVHAYTCPREFNESNDNSGTNAGLYQKILQKRATEFDILSIFTSQREQDLANNIIALARYRSDVRVKDLLIAIWGEEIQDCRGFTYDLLYSDPIKVATAFALYRIDQEKSEDYIGFIRQQLSSGNSRAASTAAISLGLIGTETDVLPLASLVLEGDIFVAGSAISALGMLKVPAGKLALEELATSDRISAEKKAIIEQVLGNPILPDQ